nr:MAG: replication initiation protein [Microvirus sp.]
MPCLGPIPATQDLDGLVTLRPYRRQAISHTDGENSYLELACGGCEACRARRARSWAIRSHHEAQTSTRVENGGDVSNGCMITLTYAPEHHDKLNRGSLDHSDFQKFMKRLRKQFGPGIRFLMCGEYGENFGRPHFHACLFGLDFHEDRTTWTVKNGLTTWRSATLENLWPMGFSTIDALNYATASYTAGYVVKKLKAPEWENETGYINSDLEICIKKPPYIAMSKKPGLGTEWFEKYWPDVYPRDRVAINGKLYSPPEFYDRLLKERQPVLYDQVVGARRKHLETLGPTSDNELAARTALFVAKAKSNNQRNQAEKWKSSLSGTPRLTPT